MQFRTLGNSGLSVSEVGFGCMSLKPDNAEASYLISKAIDSGITIFDTADLYDKGGNEILVGKAVKGKRNDVIISSKVGNQWRNDGSGWDWNPTKSYILKAIDASLKRLHTDYLDLYLLHGGTIDDPIDETIEAFEILKTSGKIKAYGISSIRPNVVREYVERSNISAVMTQFSLLDRRPEEDILQLLESKNIGVLARGSVAGGLLADKEPKPYLDWSEIEIADMISRFKSETQTPSETAIRWVLAHKAVSCAMVGIRTENQLMDAMASAGSKINQSEINRLSDLFPPKYYKDHR
ncbi:aldo/keto reductase [Flavobacterium silvaticum]|uniref:Aldo/keto reductase n=1 Tax=Flavobacterium silvaticum TaxID=1852020 RepID=A0A972FKH9_9FLAO|nr:aldo/keto reductase [Flavobacterium silvaticum]NMH26905.1 aldo/keto reductase [Flavobacterium silvaticum]